MQTNDTTAESCLQRIKLTRAKANRMRFTWKNATHSRINTLLIYRVSLQRDGANLLQHPKSVILHQLINFYSTFASTSYTYSLIIFSIKFFSVNNGMVTTNKRFLMDFIMRLTWSVSTMYMRRGPSQFPTRRDTVIHKSSQREQGGIALLTQPFKKYIVRKIIQCLSVYIPKFRQQIMILDVMLNILQDNASVPTARENSTTKTADFWHSLNYMKRGWTL